MSPKQPDRDAFESYLQSGSSLSRAYKATATETSPVELDTRILERARQAVHRQARAARSPFANNWMIPASLAALLVLTVGLVTFMFEFEKTDTPVLPETAPAPSLDSTLEEQAPLMRDKAREAYDMLRADQPVDQKATSKAKRSLVIEPPAASTPAVEGLTKTRRQSQKTGETKQMVPAAPEAASAQTADERMRSPASGGTATRTESQEMRPKKENRSLESEGALRDLDEASEVDEMMTPEEWLAKIATLRAQGKQTEAEASLAAFRKRYPDYPVDKMRE
ncbi:MAG: hypothetical protein OES46_00670 [Gammaproteobacteria bacterium]|nr:hypothetical protein [Gammaproteobacteria bacterium]